MMIERSIGFWCGAAIIVSCGFIMVYMVRAAPLEMYQWRYSPVLVFSPSIEDIRFDKQMRQLRDEEIAFKERSMIVVTVAGDEPLLADETLPPPVSPGALREEFGVDEKAFTVIMIDKSGNEIFRKEGVVDGEALVERVDELTSRRNRKKWGADGAGETAPTGNGNAPASGGDQPAAAPATTPAPASPPQPEPQQPSDSRTRAPDPLGGEPSMVPARGLGGLAPALRPAGTSAG